VFVQNARVGWCEDAVCAVCEVGNQVNHRVAQAFETQAVGERVDVQECVVCRFPVFVRRGDGAGVEPRDEELEMRYVDIV
jgi:hypothetical protein